MMKKMTLAKIIFMGFAHLGYCNTQGSFSRDCAPWDGAATALAFVTKPLSSIRLQLWKELRQGTTYELNKNEGPSQLSTGFLSYCVKVNNCEQISGTLKIIEYREKESLKGNLKYIINGKEKSEDFELKYKDIRVVCG